jgi:hypothetical protein
VRPLLAALLVLAGARPALACSAFLRAGAAPAGPVLGKSYDWDDERGLLLVNKRAVDKHALVLAPDPITFNQYGRELPNGGMNEAGLAVEVLVLPETVYERPDGRPAMTELGLVQYLLDQASTTAEAIALARQVRVDAAHARLHYFVCDVAGACATLELLDHRLAVSTGAALPVRAVTNSPYAESIGTLAHPRTGVGSLARFARLAGAVGAAPDGDPVAGAFALLDTVRFPETPDCSGSALAPSAGKARLLRRSGRSFTSSGRGASTSGAADTLP